MMPFCLLGKTQGPQLGDTWPMKFHVTWPLLPLSLSSASISPSSLGLSPAGLLQFP